MQPQHVAELPYIEGSSEGIQQDGYIVVVYGCISGVMR